MNWQDFVRAAIGTWPTATWDSDALTAYIGELAARGIEPGQAIAAIRSSDSQFPLSVGAIAALVPGGGDGHPSAEEAWALIERAVRMVGRSVYAADFAERHQAAIDWLAGQSVAVAWWAARRGLCGSGTLGNEPTDDPEFGGAVRHRLHGEYREVRAQVEAREALGRGVTRGELLVRSTGHAEGGMAEVVEMLRPALALGLGE